MLVLTLIVDGRRVSGADPTSIVPDIEHGHARAPVLVPIFCVVAQGNEWRSAGWLVQYHAVLAARMVSHEYYGRLGHAEATCRHVCHADHRVALEA